MTKEIEPPPSWEQKAIEKALMASVKEQRSSRRWKIFFRLLFLVSIIAIILLLYPSSTTGIQSHTAVVEISGTISADLEASAENINKALDSAFEDSNTKGVILKIDSGGGSPVQSGVVYSNILRLRTAHPTIKIYAVCMDICASGAYYIASAADEIYADKASLVGSIGVLMNGFGFVDAMQKLGVDRRLFTAGSEKGFLDPFLPLKPMDTKYVQSMLDNIHQQFIDSVKKGRGTRLKDDPMLFSGLVWTGEQALPLGLIDGLATPKEVAKDKVKVEKMVDYTSGNGLLKKLIGNITTSFTHQLAEEFHQRPSLVAP